LRVGAGELGPKEGIILFSVARLRVCCHPFQALYPTQRRIGRHSYVAPLRLSYSAHPSTLTVRSIQSSVKWSVPPGSHTTRQRKRSWTTLVAWALLPARSTAATSPCSLTPSSYSVSPQLGPLTPAQNRELLHGPDYSRSASAGPGENRSAPDRGLICT
jgi:hypothetical protein